jgi:hypothetical protein
MFAAQSDALRGKNTTELSIFGFEYNLRVRIFDTILADVLSNSCHENIGIIQAIEIARNNKG